MTIPGTDHIDSHLQERVLCVRINRPEKRNALTLQMYLALTQILARAENDPQVRVVLISGCEQSFSSGNDIADFIAAGAGDNDVSAVRPALDFLRQIAAFSKPLVAAVNGTAIGIGTTMLLHCDLVYAARSARFQLPFVNLGLVPEGGSSQLLPAMLGHQKAAELLMLGESFDARKACDLGLVNEVLEDESLQSFARERALQLAARPPAALAATKALLKSGRNQPLSQVLEQEGERFSERLHSAEAREAFAAFNERRQPDFSRFE